MTKELTYQEAAEQLEAVLAKLQSSDVQVDEAVELYEEGLKLIAKLEGHLKKAENRIEKLKLQAKS